MREAGLWIKDQTQLGDTILTSSVPQNTYYSERPSYNYVGQENDFVAQLASLKPRFMILSLFEQSPLWAYDWPRRNGDKVSPVKVWPNTDNPNQPGLIIYSFKNR